MTQKPEREGTMSYEDRRRFAVGVLKGIAAPVTAGNVEFLLAWMSRENTAAKNNPLATTFPSDEWTAFNYQKKDGEFVLDKDGNKIPLVKNYPDFNEGVRATVVSLLGYSGGTLGVHDYSAVLQELRDGTTPEQILGNAEAVEQIGTWGSFKSRDGFGAEDTWGYTLEELEALAPGELEQLNTEKLRPIKGYEFPDPAGSFAVEESESPAYTGPVVSDHDPRVAQRIAQESELPVEESELEATLKFAESSRERAQRFDAEQLRGGADVEQWPDPQLAGGETKFAATTLQEAFDEITEQLKHVTDPATRNALMDRREQLAKQLMWDPDELGMETSPEAESSHNFFLDAMLGVDPATGESNPENGLTDEEAKLIRDNFGATLFWTQDLDQFMIDTPDGRRVNVIEWIMDSRNDFTDEEILLWMNKTEYVQNHKDRIRKWDAKWYDAGPGVRKQLLEDPRAELLREAQRIGFNWLEDNPALLDKLAYDSARLGWGEYDIKRALAEINTFETADVARGTILAHRQTVMDAAARYYMPVSAKGANDMAWDMYLGEDTRASVEAMYRQQAKGQFPSLSGLIDQGVSMQAYFDPYKQRIGQLLEMSDVDLMNDPRLQPIMFPGSGQGPMSLSEAQTFARQLPEWQYTKNAEDAARSMVDNVGRMMGVVA
jgi:hypothetical protein